jgi:hypothetical protein
VLAPGFFSNPEIRRWLNGVMPAWTMLDKDSLYSLTQGPSLTNQTIRLETNLAEAELAGSAVACMARILLQRAANESGLKLTATGNLSRSVVAEMIDILEWPGLDKDELFRFNKVINEPDFFPVHFVRVLLQATKLVRAQRDRLPPTRLGKEMLVPGRHGALQALLVHVALWHLNLGYFDRNPIEAWPQNHTGVVLWCLSVSANDWMDREILTRLCTVPVLQVVESKWDFGSFAMESRILKPLLWFGLLEARTERSAESRVSDRRLYRKTPLFDRFLKFNVQVEQPATRH